VPEAHCAAALPGPGQYQPAGHCTVLTVAPTLQKLPAAQPVHKGEAAALL